MNLKLTIFGHEIASLSTERTPEPAPIATKDEREREFEQWKAMSDTNHGEFGFGRTDLTALEHSENRWETERHGGFK